MNFYSGIFICHSLSEALQSFVSNDLDIALR